MLRVEKHCYQWHQLWVYIIQNHTIERQQFVLYSTQDICLRTLTKGYTTLSLIAGKHGKEGLNDER